MWPGWPTPQPGPGVGCDQRLAPICSGELGLGQMQTLTIDDDAEGFTSTSRPAQQVPKTAAQLVEQLGDNGKSFSALLLDQENFLLDAGLAQHPDLTQHPYPCGVGPIADFVLPPSSRPQQGGLRPHYPVPDTFMETQSMKLDRLMAQLADSQRPVKTLSQRYE